jgi:hypothetical protein
MGYEGLMRPVQFRFASSIDGKSMGVGDREVGCIRTADICNRFLMEPWSICVFRTGALSRWLGMCRCLFAASIIIGIALGRLRLDVRGMAAVMVRQAIWFVAAGIQLCGTQATRTHGINDLCE